MALVDASRTSELVVLDIKYRHFKPEGVYFTLATLTKKRTPGKTPKEVLIHLIASYVWYNVSNTMSNAQRSSEAVVKIS